MKHVELAIIGSGPAGYSAGVYAARAQLQPTIYAGIESGGQLMYTTDVENYPGFKDGKAGPELMYEMRQQAEKFGAVVEDTFVSAVDFSQRPFRLWSELPEGVSHEIYTSGDDGAIQALTAQIRAELEPALSADAVILSTGATSRMVGVPGEKEYLGKGVSVCAVCDAAFYREKTTFVVGGGDSAMEDALALTKFADSVTIIHRRDTFRASKVMQERVLSNDKVTVLWNSELKEVHGDQLVTGITIETDGQSKELAADGVFIAIGHIPMTALFADQLVLDPHGYFVTRSSFSRAGVTAAEAALVDDLVAFPSMTSVEGVFAAGDAVDVRYKQAITAAGMGCMAALDAERWLERQ